MTDTLYPTVSGDTDLTDNWGLHLPGDFMRRMERGTLVLWRSGLTLWIDAYGTEDGLPIMDRMARDVARASEGASEVSNAIAAGVGRVSYRLDEARDDGQVVKALYTFFHGAEGQMMIAFYFDDEATAATAREIAGSVRYLGD